MDDETRTKLREAAADLAATTGHSFSRVYATLHTEANLEAEAERRGAEKGWDEGVRIALEHAARNDNDVTFLLEHPNPYRK